MSEKQDYKNGNDCCFQDRVENLSENSLLYRFLGKEEGEGFRTQIKEILLDRIREDAGQYPYYLITSDDVQEMLNEIAYEVENEIIEEYEDGIKKSLTNMILNSFGINDQ